jgi:hypothetical protein
VSLKRALANSKGKIYYGMHCYPGVARYEPPNEQPFTVLLNESVIRNMGPSFAGKPIFVQHVDDVEQNLDELRGEVDGWVIESFFNQADGKNWAKFIVVSEKGLAAIKEGWRLSNAYFPECEERPGNWNGVPYERVVVDGEYEHLAIVQNPRYEESVIMTPEQFKNYNEKQTVELKRLANSQDKKKENPMALKLFKRTKLENAPDLDGMIVELPKSKKEVLVTKAIEEYDKLVNMNGYANGDHMVKVGDKGDEMSVNDLVKKHLEMCNEMEGMKAKNAAGDNSGEVGDDNEGIINEDDESMDNADDMDDESMDNEAIEAGDPKGNVGDRGGDEYLGNEEEDKKDDKKKNSKAKNEADRKQKLANAKEKARRLKHANENAAEEETVTIALSQDQVSRGQALYGSN